MQNHTIPLGTTVILSRVSIAAGVVSKPVRQPGTWTIIRYDRNGTYRLDSVENHPAYVTAYEHELEVIG